MTNNAPVENAPDTTLQLLNITSATNATQKSELTILIMVKRELVSVIFKLSIAVLIPLNAFKSWLTEKLAIITIMLVPQTSAAMKPISALVAKLTMIAKIRKLNTVTPTKTNALRLLELSVTIALKLQTAMRVLFAKVLFAKALSTIMKSATMI